MEDYDNQTTDQVIDGITAKHPVAYLILASKFINEDNLDDATMWFYTGQIRYRAYLEANPDLDPSGYPALFDALMQTFGTPINEYAAGDIDFWIGSIDKALDWHNTHDDEFLDKTKHQKEYDEIVSGLVEMRDDISANREQIIQQRAANGLENR